MFYIQLSYLVYCDKMKTKMNTQLAIFTLIILFTTSFYLINVNLAQQNYDRRSINLNYIDSAPLEILNDTALASYASSGDGSVATPYIIEDLNITTTASAALQIMSVTTHFIIRDCLLIAGEVGLYAYQINPNVGEISNNIMKATDGGLWVQECDYLNITHNVCYGSTIGMDFEDSDHLLLESNTCYGNGQGIYIETCNYLTLYDNSLYSNSQNGAYISTNSNFPNITYNRFYSNTRTGLLVDNSKQKPSSTAVLSEMILFVV